MTDAGVTVKINTVLVPGVNDGHVGDIARAVSGVGAYIYNLIPLIPQHKLAHIPPPDCAEIERAREDAGEYVKVFRHCQHCRADAVGVPGVSEFGDKIYQKKVFEETFSHG
jgi:nitrogen fixation protein NifB